MYVVTTTSASASSPTVRPDFAKRVGHRGNGEPGGEAGGLSDPARDDARRRDDEERAEVRIELPGVADERERLQRLAEAHVVGEDAAELEAPERREPVEAVSLVGPELRVQRGGQLVLGDRVELEQSTDLPLPPLRLLGDDAERGELRPTGSPGSG